MEIQQHVLAVECVFSIARLYAPPSNVNIALTCYPRHSHNTYTTARATIYAATSSSNHLKTSQRRP